MALFWDNFQGLGLGELRGHVCGISLGLSKWEVLGMVL
jgi:hypothetical protein